MTNFPFGPNVSIDSRTLSKGDVFFALKGESFDGHDYLERAFEKGASSAVIRSDFDVPSNLKNKLFYRVEEPLDALWDHAKLHLSKMPAKRVALTGSSGKTTTKELIRCVLSACLEKEFIFATSGNLNNHIGVPLSALAVTPKHKVAIFELGMNHFGEIAALTNLVSPDIGLIINIGSAHAGNLGGIEGVARAKLELFDNLKESSVALVNADDARCAKGAEKLSLTKLSFGKEGSDVQLTNCLESFDGMRLTFSFQGKKAEGFLPMVGAHNAQNATAAIAVACALGLDFDKAVSGLKLAKTVSGRLSKKILNNNGILIDDTYNANPDSMLAGLNVLSSFDCSFRKIAVLGEMGELGAQSIEMHHSIGELLASKGVDFVYVCGTDGAAAYKEGAIAAGFDKSKIILAKDSEELSHKMTEVGKPKDVVFVKGSRSAKMEIVVAKILSQDEAGK